MIGLPICFTIIGLPVGAAIMFACCYPLMKYSQKKIDEDTERRFSKEALKEFVMLPEPEPAPTEEPQHTFPSKEDRIKDLFT